MSLNKQITKLFKDEYDAAEARNFDSDAWGNGYKDGLLDAIAALDKKVRKAIREFGK
jgi:hypothetical protein